MPRVDARVEVERGRLKHIVLTQRPVRKLPGDRGGWWPMKLRVRLGYGDRPDLVLPAEFKGETAAVQGAAGLPAPDYVWANEGDFGYGLFIPAPASADLDRGAPGRGEGRTAQGHALGRAVGSGARDQPAALALRRDRLARAAPRAR